MYFLQENIGSPKVNIVSKKNNLLMLEIGPLPMGYGVTLANSLRRVLLSSVKGTAVTAIKIKGATHEFMTIKGIKDSVLDIILNIRMLRIKKEGDDENAIVRLTVKGREGIVTAGDISCPTGIEVINTEQYITTIDSDDVELDIEMLIEDGYGFSPATERKIIEAHQIAIDALFSPVKKVRYNVSPARVGDIIDLDKIEMEVETDGTLDVYEAVKFAANRLRYYFGLFDDLSDQAVSNLKEKLSESNIISVSSGSSDDETQESLSDKTFTPIEILAFSSRTLNALINNNIDSIEKLEKIPRKTLLSMKGFGKKALVEVEIALQNMGKSLKEK